MTDLDLVLPSPSVSASPPAVLRDAGTDADPPAATYVPGHFVICALPNPLPVYHVSGWHAPEPEFTWIDGVEGVIEFVIRRPRRSYTLAIDVVPNGAGGTPQTLEVFFNYLRFGFFEVPAPTTLSIELPNEAFILRRSRINLHCLNAVARNDDAVVDARRLGIAVRGWRIF